MEPKQAHIAGNPSLDDTTGTALPRQGPPDDCDIRGRVGNKTFSVLSWPAPPQDGTILDQEEAVNSQYISHQNSGLPYIDAEPCNVADKYIIGGGIITTNNTCQEYSPDNNSNKVGFNHEFSGHCREVNKPRQQSFLWPEPPADSYTENNMDAVSESLDIDDNTPEEGSSFTDFDSSRDDIICHTNEYNDFLAEHNQAYYGRNDFIEVDDEEVGHILIPTISVTENGIALVDDDDDSNVQPAITDSNETEFSDVSTYEADPRESVQMRRPKEQFKREEIRCSTLLPPLCTAELGEAVVKLLSRIEINAMDYQGHKCKVGGDPIVVSLLNENDEHVNTNVEDLDNGSYEITFTPQTVGRHKLSVSFFDRQIQGSPFLIDVTSHNAPVLKITSAACESDKFRQPSNLLVDKEGFVYVLDSGNSRMCKFDQEGEFSQSFHGEGFERQGSTGFCLFPNGHVMIVNWRTRIITKIDTEEDKVTRNIKNDELMLPTDIAVTSRGELIVVDEGTGNVCVLDQDGYLKYRMKLENNGHTMNFQRFVAVCQSDHILVADQVIREYSRCGKYRKTLAASGETDGNYSGITVDSFDNVLASKSFRGHGWVEVYNSDRQLINVIESHGDKLRRPCGLAVTKDHHVFVTDLGDNCVKKYRYK